MNSILDRMNSPQDLKNLNYSELNLLCSEIREYMIENILNNSGHLASNLGVCELTVAIHRVFDAPNDKIIFDVGHQSYVHKILTGRKYDFVNIRKENGISGFTKRSESKFDPYGAGHSSTSLSAAIGFATAEKLKGTNNYTVAIVGDGAFTGGIIHEALNNVDKNLKLIIVLNENEMSISKNVGNMAESLARLRTSRKYLNFKHKTEYIVEKIPHIGITLASILRKFKNIIKNIMYKSNYFEDLGIYYLGPCDGNNLENMEIMLKEAKRRNGCVVIHAKTIKGKGFKPAEDNPEKYHACSKEKSSAEIYSKLICDELIKSAKTDDKICVTTAAMGAGTGMRDFFDFFPNRYFDVGIAEEHAVTFCAGLAADGMNPVFAVYSTFLQRTYDFILHDLYLQKLHITLCIDRAGFATEDGATHHGIFDVSILNEFNNSEIYTPIFSNDVIESCKKSIVSNKISAIRYSKGSPLDFLMGKFKKINQFAYCTSENIDNCDKIIITYGRIVTEALKCKNANTEIILLNKIKPFSNICSFLNQFVFKNTKIVFLEEGIYYGGAFMIISDILHKDFEKSNIKYEILAIKCDIPEQGNLENLYKKCNISNLDIENAFKKFEET